MNEIFAQLALNNVRPTKTVDGKVYSYLTTVYTEREKRQLKDELTRKGIYHRIEPLIRKDVVLGFEIFIL